MHIKLNDRGGGEVWHTQEGKIQGCDRLPKRENKEPQERNGAGEWQVQEHTKEGKAQDFWKGGEGLEKKVYEEDLERGSRQR